MKLFYYINSHKSAIRNKEEQTSKDSLCNSPKYEDRRRNTSEYNEKYEA